jgi:hypothetical protein
VDAKDETSLTELELMPDGRIFVFGASGPILEILSQLQAPDDRSVTSRLQGVSPNPSSHAPEVAVSQSARSAPSAPQAPAKIHTEQENRGKDSVILE